MSGESSRHHESFPRRVQRHDVDEIMSFFVEDCEFDTPRGPAPRGRQLRGKREARGESLIDSVGSRTSATATTSTGRARTGAYPSGPCEGRPPTDDPSRSAAVTSLYSMAIECAARTPSGRSSSRPANGDRRTRYRRRKFESKLL
jgi:hypothetical protein